MQKNIDTQIQTLSNYSLLFLFIVLFASGLIFNHASAKTTDSSFTYVVKEGDSLSSISKKFEVHVFSIKKFNKLKSNKIFAGQRLNIRVPTNNKPNFYRVRRGDSLSLIAKKFKTSVRNLKKINRLKSSKIKIGQRIYFSKTSNLININSNSRVYKVRRGDNLSLIAKKFKTSVRNLKKINRLKSSKIKLFNGSAFVTNNIPNFKPLQFV